MPITVPPSCEGGVRKPCTRHPNWRIREHGDTSDRNWDWACHDHLHQLCSNHGEGAHLDVIRVGC